MATLLDDRSTVGLWPLPGTAKRADLLAGVVTPGVGSFELRPLAFENMAEAVANGDISSVDDYVAPYQTFTLTVTAIPTVPNEVITNVSFDPIPPVPAFTPFKAILEEPNPATKASRSGAEEPQEIAPSPNWDPPLVNEPYIQTIGGVNRLLKAITCTAYTREIVVQISRLSLCNAKGCLWLLFIFCITVNHCGFAHSANPRFQKGQLF